MRRLYALLLGLLCWLTVEGQVFPFRSLPPFAVAPSEAVNCMLFDRDGMMWLGTNVGLKSYDGYTVKTYRSDAYAPNILPNNAIRSLAEDHDGNLWIGTCDGLVRMDRRTGLFRTFHLPAENQRVIYTLYVGKDGTLWVGTNGGLSFFRPEDETFHTYDGSNTWLVEANGDRQRMPGYSVKAILEDRNGDLLIGTWSAGLLRFRRGSNVMHRYPPLNALNSAYSLFFDRRHRLWVGTWGYGVLRIDNPSEVRNPVIRRYPYAITHFDIFYKIVEDPVTRKLWACTREGVCCIDWEDDRAEWQQYPRVGEVKLTYNNDIATDGQGNIWLCTQNDGIIQVTTTPSPFLNCSLDRSRTNLTIHCLASLFTGDGEWFWLGMNPYGLALYNRRTKATCYNKDIPGFSALDDRTLTTSISAIVRRSNGELWFAVNNYGIIVKPPVGNARELNRLNTGFIQEDYVNTLFESCDKTMWVGSRSGMGVAWTDGKGALLTMKEGDSDFSICDIRHIMQDRSGHIWVATDNKGIIRISGNPKKVHTLQYRQYSPDRCNFAVNGATACLEDSQGRLWAISSSSGLFLYNKETDRFEPKNREFHLPALRVLAMQEDRYGHLWLATERALVRLVMGKDNRPEHITNFTTADGIADLRFAANSCFRYGQELFFGSGAGFFSFTPGKDVADGKHESKKLVVTDLLVDDVPFAQLDTTLRSRVSKEMPAYTRHVELPASAKTLSVEFALLTYGNAAKNIYAYRLDGYDDDWRYVSGGNHRATFQNLPSGTYRLHLKATDSYGHWQPLPYALTIRVLPPWYASNLAFAVYALLLAAAVYGSARWYREHLRTKSRLQMGVVLANITHELLTPLAVISATIYKLKGQAPQYEEDYEVMDSNISRTTRLLRQMLEVRKSQAGQLRLRVSRGDLAAFVRNACENIRPMATQRGVSLTLHLPEQEKTVWFDADKLDKILYNLLSNAIKYNREKGGVDVTLALSADAATVTVRDTGIGLSKDQQKHLYTRFFDGDYRQQHSTGTGIGLSLTRDLVRLHHGTIRCESTEGVGTTFTVSFPIRKSAYAPGETEGAEKTAQVEQDDAPANVPRHPFIRKNASKILVVEDNVELLGLMQQVLGKNYHVFTARNGKQAVGILRKEKLDLVVSDVMMPVMDGIELVRYLKADKSFWQLPVILLTAKNKEEDQTEAYSAGADAYITKPFRFEDLKVRIDALLANRKRMVEKIETEHALRNKAADDAAREKRHLSNPDQAFVTRATEMVMKHLGDADYDRQTFAKDMAMGESSLYNKVKATTGQTVVAFITTIRLREAQRLLRQNPDALIGDVAARVGFNTPKYFSKCFRKEFGMYPKEYAEEQKKAKI